MLRKIDDTKPEVYSKVRIYAGVEVFQDAIGGAQLIDDQNLLAEHRDLGLEGYANAHPRS